MTERKQILFGSRNNGKIAEVLSITSDLCNIEIKTCLDYPDIIEPIESGNTLNKNALIKAQSYYEQTGLPCFSDDSGLFVYALDKLPGVNSAYYAGINATDKENYELIIRNMRGAKDRRAYLKTVFCYLESKDVTPLFFSATLKGTIATSPIGENGFGYDKIFIPQIRYNYDTIAVLTHEEKLKISQRTMALNKLKLHLLHISFAVSR